MVVWWLGCWIVWICSPSFSLEAKDVLPNINHVQATEMAEKCDFCPWWPWPFTFDIDLQTQWGTKRVFHMNLAQIHSAFPKIFHTQKNHRLMAPKREFPHFTACGNNWQHELATSYFRWNFFKRAYKSWFLGYKCVGVHILDGSLHLVLVSWVLFAHIVEEKIVDICC